MLISRPNGLRLRCGASWTISQTEDYHSRTGPPASGACQTAPNQGPLAGSQAVLKAIGGIIATHDVSGCRDGSAKNCVTMEA